MLAIANFAGLGLYCFVISKVAIELFNSQPLNWMTTLNTVKGQIWLTVEFVTFISVLISNMIFMLLRSCREVQVKFDLIDKKKQLPSTDTLESVAILI